MVQSAYPIKPMGIASCPGPDGMWRQLSEAARERALPASVLIGQRRGSAAAVLDRKRACSPVLSIRAIRQQADHGEVRTTAAREKTRRTLSTTSPGPACWHHLLAVSQGSLPAARFPVRPGQVRKEAG